MGAGSFFKSHVGLELQQFHALPRDRAAALLRERVPDLLRFFGRDMRGPQREPARVEGMAVELEKHLLEALRVHGRDQQNLRDRILIDGFSRHEFDRDQNVYLGPFYTRFLTRAVPDVVFQPVTHDELERALDWARRRGMGVATRGAGSTAMGGAVPNNGGLLLDMSRFDGIQIDARDHVAIVGAGARFKQIHEKLAKAGLALKTCPSNLGGTLAGWFSSGGLGLNSFKYGRVQNQVRALSAVLPQGEHVRFHDDGRLDVHSSSKTQQFTPEQAEAWLSTRGYPVLRLGDLAQTEGQFGVLLSFTIEVIPLPRMQPFYFEFDDENEALHFLKWVQDTAEPRGCPPTNLKFLSREHVEAVRIVRGDKPGAAKNGVYVDFDDGEEAQRFEAGLEAGKWRVRRGDSEAWKWFDERFRPQQTKRLGPGFLAAEILLPAHHVERFLDRARTLARGVGVHLEAEVYFFNDGRALALPGYLTRGPRFGFLFELLLAPMLADLAMSRYDGQPYVLGRWQSAFFNSVFAAGTGRRLRRAKKKFDPAWTLNPGVFFAPAFRLRGVSTLFRLTFQPMLRVARVLYSTGFTRHLVRAIIGNRANRGAPGHVLRRSAESGSNGAPAPPQRAFEELAASTIGCVNCGECNSVCPIFHDAKIRLPQMLTHVGEELTDGSTLDATPQLLLDLCMRCGNCEQVCQAGIPHLDLYAAMEERSGRFDAVRRERHTGILAHLRHSDGYVRDFLGVRPGGYLQRTAASLPGELRFLLFRADNGDGADATCIHCAACVPVCPTNANKEYESEEDVRRITTDLARCIGCGTCVEVCPANLKNGGRTLRVMEAPNNEFFDVLETVSASLISATPGASTMSARAEASAPSGDGSSAAGVGG